MTNMIRIKYNNILKLKWSPNHLFVRVYGFDYAPLIYHENNVISRLWLQYYDQACKIDKYNEQIFE